MQKIETKEPHIIFITTIVFNNVQKGKDNILKWRYRDWSFNLFSIKSNIFRIARGDSVQYLYKLKRSNNNGNKHE